MKVIVVGCGRVGSAVAYQLFKQGHQVTVIDQERSAFDNLPADFLGRRIEGDVLAKNVLVRAQIEQADALAAVTQSDSLNILIAHLAKTEFNVSKVIAGNADPRKRSIQEGFGLPTIGSASWGAQRVLELFSDSPLRAIHSNGNSRSTIYQLEVSDAWIGRSIKELLAGDRTRMLTLIRAGLPMPVIDVDRLESGDVIYLSGDAEAIESLRKRLGVEEEPIE